jgi:hypothetical protein
MRSTIVAASNREKMILRVVTLGRIQAAAANRPWARGG